MRTSLRVFTAAVSTLLLAALVVVSPFTPKAAALNGVSVIHLSNASFNEGNSSITFNATVQPAPSIPFDNISAQIKPTDDSARKGQDYNDFTAQVSWAAGDSATKQITVPNVIKQDGFREPDEKFAITVVNPVSASAGTPGAITITNDDGGPIPTITISAPAAAAEGNANNIRTVTATLTNYGGQTTTINYATGDGSATSDSAAGALDYTKQGTGTLTFNGNGAQNVDIEVRGDTNPEPDERFFLNFGSPNNAQVAGPNPANIDLLNDDGTASDVPKLTLENIPDKTEGDTSTTTQTVTVSLAPAANQTVTVKYATADGTAVASTDQAQGDYTKTEGVLTIPQGTTTKTFTIPIVGDPADEIDETYNVTLSAPTNATIAEPATKAAKILNDDFGQITTGPASNGGPHLRLFGATGSDLGGFFAYEAQLTSGIHVARGDFFRADGSAGGDGIDEIITAPSQFGRNSSLKSRPVVRIFAVDGTQRASFFAYDPNFPGGVYIGAGNLDGDTSNGDELVVGAGGGGGPHVKVLRIKGPGDNIGVLNSFFAYDNGFPGGVRIAVGNVSGDAKEEIITAPGPGGGPHVRVWRPEANGGATPIAGLMAYSPQFTGGVFIAAGQGRIVTGPGAGGGPHIRLWDGSGNPQGGGFMAYDPAFTGGVTVALGNLDNNLAAEVITGPGPGGGPHVKIFGQDGSQPFGGGFMAYAPNFSGGVEVAVSVGGA